MSFIRFLKAPAFIACWAMVLPSASCRRPTPTSSNVAPNTAASGSTSVNTANLRAAELRRDSEAVQDADLANGSVEVRRAATRALAQMQNPRNIDRQLGSLADGDPQVLAWAAYGLGQVCKTNRDRITRALVARSMSLLLDVAHEPGSLDPWFAMARALGNCGTVEAERTLVAWLDGPKERAAVAALGLGDIAGRKKKLEEETAAALLRSAGGDAARDPLAEALFPFSRLVAAPPRVVEQQLAAGQHALDRAGAPRIFAVRTIGRVGSLGIDDLVKIATAPSGYTAAERAEAALALGRIKGKNAMRALGRIVDQLAPGDDPVSLSALVGPGYHALISALEALDRSEIRGARSVPRLASLPVPPNAPTAVARRVVTLRCAAARLVADDLGDPRLGSCDPLSTGTAGALARIAVLDRTRLTGPNLVAWRALLDPKFSAEVREAALRLIASHPEVDASQDLAAAIESPDLGVVATAAELLSQYPDRAYVGPKIREHRSSDAGASNPEPSEPITRAISSAFARKFPADAVETIGQLAKAAGALRMQSARKVLEGMCRSPNPTLREDAQSALASMDSQKPECERDASVQAPLPAELGHLLSTQTRVTLNTDAGRLTIDLDPRNAPVAATRIADLVRKGFFDGMAIHRVVPGFVVQFGDRGGDGYGGADMDPLPCETAPIPFVERTVGIALAGRDTGSSQLFITLSPTPHLDGQYAVIGTATGPWDSVVQGDLIESAVVTPSPGTH